MLALSACGGGTASLPTASPPATPVVITVVVQPTAAPASTSVALPSVTPQPTDAPTPTAGAIATALPTLTPTPKPATSTPKPPATATPKPPTATPAPAVSFSVNPNAIYKGDQAKISWQTQNVDAVWLDNASVPPSSEMMVSPTATRDYKLTVKYKDGTQKDFVKTLTVKPNEYIADISADNQLLNLWFMPAPKKVCTTLRWARGGKGTGTNVVDGSITGGGLNISLKPPAKGFPILLLPNREVCFTAVGSTIYNMHVEFADGTTRNDSVTVTVVNESPIIKITPIIKP